MGEQCGPIFRRRSTLIILHSISQLVLCIFCTLGYLSIRFTFHFHHPSIVHIFRARKFSFTHTGSRPAWGLDLNSVDFSYQVTGPARKNAGPGPWTSGIFDPCTPVITLSPARSTLNSSQIGLIKICIFLPQPRILSWTMSRALWLLAAKYMKYMYCWILPEPSCVTQLPKCLWVWLSKKLKWLFRQGKELSSRHQMM